MEGYLKKRGAVIPKMFDRYCVIDKASNSLLSFKDEQHRIKTPETPMSQHLVKSIREWNGKGFFHTYPNSFLIETKKNVIFHCSAPTLEEKEQWLICLRSPESTLMKTSTEANKIEQTTCEMDQITNEFEMEQIFTDRNRIDQFHDHDIDYGMDYGRNHEICHESESGNERLFRSSNRAASGEPEDWAVYASPKAIRSADCSVILLDDELLNLDVKKNDDSLDIHDVPMTFGNVEIGLEQFNMSEKSNSLRSGHNDDGDDDAREENESALYSSEDNSGGDMDYKAAAAARLQHMRDDKRRDLMRRRSLKVQREIIHKYESPKGEISKIVESQKGESTVEMWKEAISRLDPPSSSEMFLTTQHDQESLDHSTTNPSLHSVVAHDSKLKMEDNSSYSETTQEIDRRMDKFYSRPPHHHHPNGQRPSMEDTNISIPRTSHRRVKKRTTKRNERISKHNEAKNKTSNHRLYDYQDDHGREKYSQTHSQDQDSSDFEKNDKIRKKDKNKKKDKVKNKDKKTDKNRKSIQMKKHNVEDKEATHQLKPLPSHPSPNHPPPSLASESNYIHPDPRRVQYHQEETSFIGPPLPPPLPTQLALSASISHHPIQYGPTPPNQPYIPPPSRVSQGGMALPDLPDLPSW